MYTTTTKKYNNKNYTTTTIIQQQQKLYNNNKNYTTNLWLSLYCDRLGQLPCALVLHSSIWVLEHILHIWWLGLL